MVRVGRKSVPRSPVTMLILLCPVQTLIICVIFNLGIVADIIYDQVGLLFLVASHGLQNPWSNESSGGTPWCDESRGVIFNNPLDAILNQQQNKSGNVRHS